MSRQLQSALEESSMKERSMRELQKDLGLSQTRCNELKAQGEKLKQQVSTLTAASKDARKALTEEVNKYNS